MSEKPSHAAFMRLLKEQLSLPRLSKDAPVVLDLFAGCGGLALGFEAAGFRTKGFEILADAVASYNRNLHGECARAELNVGFDYGLRPDVIIGGPPCQPFSVNGHQKGLSDSRDGFPAFLDAVKRLDPSVAVFENVRGMLYRNRSYLDEIVLYLQSLGYAVQWKLLKAVEFSVPQKRERIFVVAHKVDWSFPQGSPMRFTAGNALGHLAAKVPTNAKFLTESMDQYVARYEKKSDCVRPRDLHLNEPARTVTCRNLHGATGDMHRVRLKDGRRRRLVVREGARLQSFPDWFQFEGSEGSQFNQIGNAVPPLLARAVADSIYTALESNLRLSGSDVKHINSPVQGELIFG